MRQTEPQFLSDPMSDRKKKVFANSEYKLVNVKDTSKLVNIRVSTYIHICYMLFNQQQCFIYSTASFLAKLRAKKVEKLHNSS